MKSRSIVTKDWLKKKVEENPARTVGRALVAIFRRQVNEEQSSNHTRYKNGAGFSANDARIGSLAAKYYMAHGTLLDWQIKGWVKDVKGYPRICKYVKQLNEIANGISINEESAENI